jgi:VIT1/CCC1 family predicted Fe2+/Mn2+ transporter
MADSNESAFQAGFDEVRYPRRAETRAECERRGIHWARACVGNRSDGEVAQHMAEWIDEFEEREARQRAEQEFLLTERGVIAAEKSAGSAEESARSASGSTRAAYASAAFAFFALVVSIAAYFKS